MFEKRRILKIIAVVISIAIGILLASYDSLSKSGATSAGQAQETLDSSVQRTQKGRPIPDKGSPEHESKNESAQFSTGSGAVLTFARSGDQFIGFVVIDPGSDNRLRAGGIITAVNGMAAEDSAAGSELLMIALENQDSQIIFADTDSQ